MGASRITISVKNTRCGLAILVPGVLRGFSQVMLQRNVVTGCLFIAGLAAGSPFHAFYAFMAVAIATVAAAVLGYETDRIRDGIYGYNAALLAIGLALYLPITAGSIVLTAAMTVLTVPCSKWMMKHGQQVGLPALTAPFVILAWAALGVAEPLRHAGAGIVVSEPFSMTLGTLVGTMLTGVGQIFFQPTVASGCLIVLGMLVGAPGRAVVVVVCSFVGTLAALAVSSPPYQSVADGIYGYNAALAGLALVMFAKKTSHGLPLAIAGAGCSSVLMVFYCNHPQFDIPPLTFPFVATVWVALWAEKRILEHAALIRGA